jgi:hypothetical protein
LQRALAAGAAPRQFVGSLPECDQFIEIGIGLPELLDIGVGSSRGECGDEERAHK